MNSHFITAKAEDANMRLDKFLAENTPLSRSKLQNLIKSGNVLVNDRNICDINHKILENDNVTVNISEVKSDDIKPKSIDLDIIYEDDDIIIINKQSGLTVHPGAGNHDDTMVNALVAHYGKNLSSIGGDERPGIVHRLDRDTTGLIIVAKSDKSHEILSKAIENREVTRIYKAFVWGVPKLSHDVIETNIDRSKADRKRMAVCNAPKGKVAITHYKVINSWNNISLLECQLETGRTHQIRVHMSHIGHSVLGDQVYGNNARKILHNTAGDLKTCLESFKRQALHSYKLEFTHPITKESMSFTADIPEDMNEILKILEIDPNHR
ncbi:MAG UNVERIFIED_CONTAM: RluA family pseudouridine synthase [Rickettsiaceae bacterium]|jgi:23S rRNA pseudouridine1911/1915/1917 synthase